MTNDKKKRIINLLPSRRRDNITKYFYYLICQFNSAKGIKNPDLNSKVYIEEFANWLYEQRKGYDELKKYFEFFEIDINSSSLAEVGKGKYDSIVLPTTQIISPFGETLKKENSELIIYQGEPIILGSKDKGQVVDKFLTHNPYTFEIIKDWSTLHNNNYDIIVGICGTIYDKNIQDRKEQMIYLVHGMNEEYEENYDLINDIYVGYIRSNRKIKRLVKTK